MSELFEERAKKAAQRILWFRGDLSWKLHSAQEKIERAYQKAVGKLFVGDCSRQLGKTTWGAKTCIELALKKRRAKIRVGTAFLSDLEQFVLPAFEFILQDCPEGLRPKWNTQKYCYTFPSTGAEIRLVGLDRKPNGLRGNKLDLVLLEEAGFISNLKRLYQYVLIPATTHVPDAKIIMLSTQPDTPDHDFTVFCDRAFDEGCYIQLDIDENPLLSQSQKDDIALEYAPPESAHLPRAERIALGRESTAYRREYLCHRVVDSERAIVPEFSRDAARGLIYERPETEYDKFYHRYLWMDIGVQKDLTVILFVLYAFKEALAYVEDEVVIRGPTVTTEKIAQAITAKIAQRKAYEKTYRKIADNSHPLLLNDLTADYSIYFTATDKAKLHEMVGELRIFVGQNRLKAHPRCTHFIGAMSTGVWAKNRKEFDHSTVHGHYDAIAAAVYGVRNLDVNTNPVPLNYGVDLENTFLARQKKPVSPLAKTLAEAFFKKPKR